MTNGLMRIIITVLGIDSLLFNEGRQMGMKLDEAIERHKNNAEYERTHGDLQGYLEFRQLAKWLVELRAYRNMYHADNVDNFLREKVEKRWHS